MHSDFFIYFLKLFAFAFLFSIYHQCFRTHISFFHIDDRAENSLNTSKKNLLNEQKIEEYQSKATFAKNKNKN